MAMDDALTNALYSGGQSYMTGAGYDPRQAGPAPDPRLAPQYGPAQPAPYVPPPNVPRPGGTSLGGLWDRLKEAMPWSRLSQPGYGGGGPAPGGGAASPWGR